MGKNNWQVAKFSAEKIRSVSSCKHHFLGEQKPTHKPRQMHLLLIHNTCWCRTLQWKLKTGCKCFLSCSIIYNILFWSLWLLYGSFFAWNWCLTFTGELPVLELFLWSWISSNRSPVTKVNNIQDPVAPSGGGKQLLKSFLFKKQVLFELETNSFKKHKNKCQKVI